MSRLTKISKEVLDKADGLKFRQQIGLADEYQDWRDPELRQELFNRYYHWRVLAHDLDHVHYMKTLCKDYDYERRAWFAMCFGMTYRTPQAYAYTETFPSIHDVTEEWHKKNWQRTTYGTDARYNKGHFFSQVESVRKWLGGKTFKEKIEPLMQHKTQRENFWALYTEILSLYKFGRMTGWICMQALYDLLNLPIDPGQIMIEGYSPMNDSSLGSIWNGLCAYENTPEKMIGHYGNYQVTKKDAAEADSKLMEYTTKAEQNCGLTIDSFRKESIWCQYKRFFNEGMSKEYPGHAAGDATSRYMYYREHWPEIDWRNFRIALRTQPGIIKGMDFVGWFDQIFGETGIPLNLHELYPDMPNGYELLEIKPAAYRVNEIWTDDGLAVPTTFDMKKDIEDGIAVY